MEQFCKIFFNIEELTCTVNKRNDLLFLLSRLSKLSILNVSIFSVDHPKRFSCWLKHEAEKVKITFNLKNDDCNMRSVCI